MTNYGSNLVEKLMLKANIKNYIIFLENSIELIEIDNYEAYLVSFKKETTKEIMEN